MALLTAQTIPITGLNATYGAVSASDTIAGRSNLVLHVKNAGGSPDNVTVVVPGTAYGQNNPDVVVAVPAGENRFIFFDSYPGLLDSSGLITVTHSFTTSVTQALMVHV